jgi:hypothetical protein
VFVTDNRFDKDTNPTRASNSSTQTVSVPIFDKSFFEMIVDYNEDGTNMGPVENQGRRTIIYRRTASAR